jgi:hypothetical protein
VLIFGAAGCRLRVQQRAMPVIGYLSARSPESAALVVAAYRGVLAEGGFTEGNKWRFCCGA